MDKWGELREETVNGGSIQKLRKLYDSNKSSRDGAPLV